MLSILLSILLPYFFQELYGSSETISKYKIIPPCSLCAQQDTVLLKSKDEESSFSDLERKIELLGYEDNDNQEHNEEENEEESTKWKIDKKSHTYKLKINYKDNFDVYFKRLPIINEVSEKEKIWPEIRITPKLMTLFLYTPTTNGLSRKDFRCAYEISKAMSEKKPKTDNKPKTTQKSTRMTIDQIQFSLFKNAPLWNITFLGGRKISRTLSFNSFADAIHCVETLTMFSELEIQLDEIYISNRSVKITLQRKEGNSVYAETVALAIKIEALLKANNIK